MPMSARRLPDVYDVRAGSGRWRYEALQAGRHQPCTCAARIQVPGGHTEVGVVAENRDGLRVVEVHGAFELRRMP